MHIFVKQLLYCITFYYFSTMSTSISTSFSSKTLLLLHCHLVPSLQHQYLELESSNEFQHTVISRFNYIKSIFLLRALHDSTHLRVLDFPILNSFNNELYCIISKLTSCDKAITEMKMIEKTLSTFSPVSTVLVQDYRNMKFENHLDFMSLLLLPKK